MTYKSGDTFSEDPELQLQSTGLWDQNHNTQLPALPDDSADWGWGAVPIGLREFVRSLDVPAQNKGQLNSSAKVWDQPPTNLHCKYTKYTQVLTINKNHQEEYTEL
jgi:hypothetical protein